jgi:hypothetical protein
LPEAREKVFLSLQGRVVDLVKKGSDWVARHDAPELLLREQNGTWILFDGRGVTWTFTSPSTQTMTGAGLWLLSSVTSPGGNKVQLDYEIGTPALPGDVLVQGVSIDLVRISYNMHPTSGCPKNEIGLTYGATQTSPLSMSMLGDVTLARMRTLANVDVMSRPDCSASAERLRRYAFAYLPDADTQQPQLSSVQMFGRQGTLEENTAVPIARYTYGSVSSGGTLTYQKTQSIPLPAGADSTNISSTEWGAVNAPTGGVHGSVGYVTWQSLTDVTGDGRPDFLYQNAGKLWVARNIPTSDGSTMFGPIGELHDAAFTNGAFETRTATNNRFNYNDVNIDEVWRKEIDVNGDGRVDIIDAGEEAGYWIIYLNTPDPGPSGVKWVRIRVSVTALYHHLWVRGHWVDGNYVPLSRRFTAHEYTQSGCWIWDGSQWLDYPQGFGNVCGPNWGTSSIKEVTFTEWDLIDLNGDGYPDVVMNSAHMDVYPIGAPTKKQKGSVIGQIRANPVQYTVLPASLFDPNSPKDNEIDAVINLAGVHFTDLNNLFSIPIPLKLHTNCGVRKWEGDGSGQAQAVDCDIADVNGDGLADRVEGLDGFLGTGNGFSNVKLRLPGPLAGQGSDAYRCHDPTHPSTIFSAGQSAGLRDLNGDGIPDYVEQPGQVWRVWIGTGTGFAPPINIEVPGWEFVFSGQTESCDGQFSRTWGGLYDVDGDGKPEVVFHNNNGFLDVYQLAGGSVPRTPEAGRLVQVDNGYGAKTTIGYRSAKEDGTTSHQVPFPEIVVTSVETTGTQGLGGTLSATRYAYGGAELIFDSALDAFTLPGYQRSVELRLVPALGGKFDGLATLTDTYGLAPFAVTPKNERFGRYLRAARVRDRTVLAGVPADPWALLTVDVTADPRRVAATHYDWAPKLFEEPAAEPFDCIDMMYPYDYSTSFGWNLGPNAYNVCSAHGFLYGSATNT